MKPNNETGAQFGNDQHLEQVNTQTTEITGMASGKFELSALWAGFF